MPTTRRTTANILVTIPKERAKVRLRRLVHASDVLALQESPPSRNKILASFGSLVKWPRLRKRETRGDMTFHRARRGGGPIGLRNSLGERVLSCRAVKLVGAGRVDRVPGRRTLLGASWATRLKTILPDGTIKVRYNIHLTAGVQVGKEGYRSGRPKRVARHLAERRALNALVESDIEKGYEPEVYGDTNFHKMVISYLHGWWEGNDDAGTLGSRTIDGIWTLERQGEPRFFPAMVAGEHRHVVVPGPA